MSFVHIHMRMSSDALLCLRRQLGLRLGLWWLRMGLQMCQPSLGCPPQQLTSHYPVLNEWQSADMYTGGIEMALESRTKAYTMIHPYMRAHHHIILSFHFLSRYTVWEQSGMTLGSTSFEQHLIRYSMPAKLMEITLCLGPETRW